jgi:hypothetical protein
MVSSSSGIVKKREKTMDKIGRLATHKFSLDLWCEGMGSYIKQFLEQMWEAMSIKMA